MGQHTAHVQTIKGQFIMRPDVHVMTLRICVSLLLAVALGACGFQLRGSNLGALKNSHIYIKSGGANQLASQIKKQLEFAEELRFEFLIVKEPISVANLK